MMNLSTHMEFPEYPEMNWPVNLEINYITLEADIPQLTEACYRCF